MSDRPRTIRVLIHIGSGGRVAIGLSRSVWQGPHRLDMRLASAVPVEPRGPIPRGVDPDLWLAYTALSDRVWAIARENDPGIW